MKRIIKNSIKKVPGVKPIASRLNFTNRSLTHIQNQLNHIQNQMDNSDTRLNRLKALLKEVEHYQSTYHVSGLIDTPMRDSQDRCKTINAYLGDVSGMRILDIGASLGYVCYYFSDRGAVTEGWEYNSKNAEVARLVGEINGIDTTIKTKAFDNETVTNIKKGDYDVVMLLSVLHHTIYYNSLEYTQKLMKELLENVSTVIVELARKGEDPKLYWDKKLPKSELEIFDLVKDDVEIKKIGEFSNHLSNKTRPLYVVTSKNKTINVNNRSYKYNESKTLSYKDVMIDKSHRRNYYLSSNHIIKKYTYINKENNKEDENLRQIIAEINTYLQINKVHNMPRMVDFELTNEGAAIVLERIKGELVVDLIEENKDINIYVVIKDVLKSLADLEQEKLYHNDVRTWNVIYDGKKASLIDYGLTSHVKKDNDLISLLWVVNAVLTRSREDNRTKKQDLPLESVFKTDKRLQKLYKIVASGETSPSKVLESFSDTAVAHSGA